MSKYTHTMALATVNECHGRECNAGHWIAAGITGQLHADFVKHGHSPAVTIPKVEDIRSTVTRYIRYLVDKHKTVTMWVHEPTCGWGIRQDILGLSPIKQACASVTVDIYPDSHPGDTCRHLISELRDEVGITEVDEDHPLLRSLRAERDPNAVSALRAALSR